RQGGEESGFGDGQLVERLVEVLQRRRRDAVGAAAEIDLVEIELEDAVLRKRLLDPQRDERLLDLPFDRELVREKEVLRDLLRDGGGADRAPAGAGEHEVGDG